MPSKSHKKEKGGALAFSVVLIIVLIMIGLAFFAITLYFGGAQETKDAINAGALNTAKQALGINVTLSGDPSQQFFNDVSDSGGQVNLKNINRVWAKALFVAINADGAKNDPQGDHSGSGSSSADAAQAAAQAISANLAGQLNTPSNLYGFFDQYAMANSVRMLGLAASVQHMPDSDWVNSYLERGYESNIEFLNNWPLYYSNSTLRETTQRVPPPGDAGTRQFLMGYTPLVIGTTPYWQVAYPFEQKPHVIDRKYFDANKSTPLNITGYTWDSPVPNAFGVAGTTSKTSTGYNETGVSWAVTNPQQIYPMVFPNGFIKVIIHKNSLQWNPDGIPADSTDYGFMTDTKDSIPYPIGCGTMSATAYVGNEYIPPTLYQALTALPPSSGQIIPYILQRVQEMIPNYSQGALTGVLSACPILPDDSDQTFYIYPIANNTTVIATPDTATMLPSGCDKSASADGTQYTLESEPAIPIPNFAIEQFDCYGSYSFPTYCTDSGTRSWTPGTGWNGGCLGQVDIQRTTNVYLFGVCPCP